MLMSQTSFYKWLSKYGVMDIISDEADENRRLKRMYAEEKLKAEIAERPSKKSGEASRCKEMEQRACEDCQVSIRLVCGV